MSGRRMVIHLAPKRRHHRRRRMHGGGPIMNFLGKANDFLRKNKIISTVGNALGSLGVPLAGTIGSAAAGLGYGRRRYHRRGGALRLAGAGLGLAGGRVHHRRMHHRRY